MKHKYIIIDTNNIIECFEVGYKNVSNNIEALKGLEKLLDEDKVRLLLPEIIELEVNRLISEKQDELKNAYETAREKVESIVNNKEVLQNIDRLLDSAQKEFLECETLVQKIFNNTNTIKIALTSEVLLNAYKRGIAGIKPYKKSTGGFAKFMHGVQPDCLVIEMTKSYLQDIDYEQLYLCTKDTDYLDGEDLHKDIESDFINIKHKMTLLELLGEEFSLKLKMPDVATIEEGDLRSPATVRNTSKIQALVQNLEHAASFDAARRHMSALILNINSIDSYWLKKILDAVILNPEGYTINQVLSVDNEMMFTKRLYMYMPEHVEIWQRFANNLIILLNEKPGPLEPYNWLFKELGMTTFDPNAINLDDIPF